MEIKCPNCEKEIDCDLEYMFWDTKTICPECKEKIIIRYDFYTSEDDEEFPVYTPEQSTEASYNNPAVDYVKSTTTEK